MNMKIAVRDWLYQHRWDTEVTLTFSNDVSASQAQQSLRRFWNRVDKKLYGNAVKNFNKRCERMNVMEGDGDISRHHIHILAKRPTDRFATVTAFCDFMRDQWLIDNPNNFVATFSPIRDQSAYINYTTKKVQRLQCDALVLDSSHISAAN